MDDGEQKIIPLRTYEGDVAEAIRKTNASVASINIAEQKRKAETKNSSDLGEKTESFARNGLISLVSILLILVAGGTLAILFFLQKDKTPEIVVTQRSVISTDNLKEVDVSGLGREELIKVINSSLEKKSAGSVTEIRLMENGPSGSYQILPEQFFTIIGKGAPSSLARAIGEPWMFGSFSTNERAESFILVAVNSFDNTFDGMLRWEKSMANDLREIFIDHETMVGTSTLKVTPEVKENFEDLIIKSRNTRVLKDTRGNVIVLYSFLSDKYLVITTSEQSFREILNRFLASRFVR